MMPALVLVPKFAPPPRDPLAFVRVAGEGRFVHVASPSAFERHARSHAEFPRCPSPLVTHCTRRIGAARLTLDDVTCPACKPDAERNAALDVTREILADGCL